MFQLPARICLSAVLAFLPLVGCTTTADAESSAVARAVTDTSSAVYELRTYTTHPGRLDALHARFSNHTMQLFERHGMENVAYWTPAEQPETLIYLLRHASHDAAAVSWKAFVDDPQWQQAYADSIADGPIVANIEKVFLSTTAYSPVIAR